MRRELVSCLVAGTLVIATAGAAIAQEEGLPSGEDPNDLERVEVPEAGIAMAFPSEWIVDVEMAYDETSPEDTETARWSVLFARPTDWASWCDLTWYVYPAGDLAGFADILADSFVESYGEDSVAQVTQVSLPVAEAYRVDVQDPQKPNYSSVFAFELDQGRFLLTCSADERHATDWMGIAGAIESLATEPAADAATEPPGEEAVDPEPAAEPTTEPAADGDGQAESQLVFSTPAYDLEPVDLPEVGIAMSWPADWDTEVRMDEDEYLLPPEYADQAPVYVVDAVYGEAELGDWCGLKVHPASPMTLDEHAAWDEQSYAAGLPESMTVERTPVLVGDGMAQQIDLAETDDSYRVRIYLFESGGTRYELMCASQFDTNPAWYVMADSIVPLGEQAVPIGETQRVELADAGLGLSVPAEWTAEPQKEPMVTNLPPPYADRGEVTMWRALQSYSADDEWCNLYWYDDMPMSLDEHAAWFESMVSSNPEYPATVELDRVGLPIGESARLVEAYEFGEVHVIYLFDHDDKRGYLVCGATALPDDAWQSVAETLGPISELPGDAPPSAPADVIATHEVSDFEITLPVADPSQGATLMRAWCDRGLWSEHANGSFSERLECSLTDDPVVPAESQGQRPVEQVTLTGGACERLSGFWSAYDGSDVWASSWLATLDPDGEVTLTMSYAAEGLDCAVG